MSSTSRKRMLCVVYEPGNFYVWMKLVAWGRASGRFDCILWSPYCLPESSHYRHEAMAAGSVYVEETSANGGLADVASRLSGWLSAQAPRLPLDLLACMSGTQSQCSRPVTSAKAMALASQLPEQERQAVWECVDAIRRRIHVCDDWLARLGVDVVVLAEDNVERDSYAWIESARSRQIKSIVLSYGAISAQEAVNAYKRSAAHATSQTIVAAVRRDFPHWLAEGDDFSITRLPFQAMLARELTATAPVNPWLVNSGRADVIALESAAVEKAYLELGFPPAQLRVIGHPFHDVLAATARGRDQRREALFTQYGMRSDRPLAVVAMPPNQFPQRQGVYSTYAELIQAFARLPMELAGCNVVISPHPNISEQERRMIRDTGAVLIEAPVADLLPLADIYIACVSSTIKWALACGVPIINYDCYGYQYPDYRELPQVISADDESAYRSALMAVGHGDSLRRLSALAQSQSHCWGVLDGQAFDRLISACFVH